MIEMDPLIPAILIGVIALIVGFVLGAGIAFLSPRGNSGVKQDSKLNSVVHVWRNKRSKTLVLEIDNQYIEHGSNLSAQQYDELAGLIIELRRWLGIIEQDRSATEASPRSNVEQTTLNLSKVNQINPEAIDVLRIAEPVEPVKVSPFDAIAKILAADKLKQEPPPLSIAEQIDEIIQERLPGSPLSNHLVRLMNVPERGAIVVIDHEEFEGVSEVPYEDIKKFIQECVAEWEKRTGV